MYIGLTSTGEYKIFGTERAMYEEKSKYKYCIFDCSSNLKGPVHAIVKTKDLGRLPEELKIELTINISQTDVAIDKIHSAKMEYDVESLRGMYSIVTNMYQYDLYNAYICETNDEIEMNECILLEDIRIFFRKDQETNTRIFHYFYDAPCDYLTQFLKSVNMNICTGKTFNCKDYLVFDKDGTYRFTNKVQSSAKYVGIYINETQSFYLLTYKQFERFNRVDSMEVSIAKKVIDISNNIDYSLDQSSSFWHIGINYEALLVIPQYIMLHSQYVNDNVVICASISIDGEEYNVIAEKHEIESSGFSLFKIIDRLTKL